MKEEAIIGVDLGGTKVNVGRIEGNKVVEEAARMISAQDTEEIVLQEIKATMEKVWANNIIGIGIGVPSLVNSEKGIVYSVQNIPSWKEVNVKKKLEEYFNVPVYVNNDANCFVIGQKYFGKGKNYKNMVGLTLGTGIGAGIIINNQLYCGTHCGAGEFGSIPYKENNYEYYCSGQYFKDEYAVRGEELQKRAERGDNEALKIFNEFGHNVGKLIKTIIYTLNPEAIIIGGSISRVFKFYKDTLFEEINLIEFAYVSDEIVIEVDTNPQIAILGAGALYFDATFNNVNRIQEFAINK